MLCLSLVCSPVVRPARFSGYRSPHFLMTFPACDIHRKAYSIVVPEILLKVQHLENKLEHSQFTSADGVNEDLALNDQMIDILSSEDPGSMLQALEE